MPRTRAAARSVRAPAGPHRLGQALVEFVLVTPILIILFVGIADFGRVFATGIITEAASRDAAELTAQGYLSDPPGDLAAGASPTDANAYYSALHQLAATVVCAETDQLPNADQSPADGTCATWPVVRVCVHDGVDPLCGEAVPGFRTDLPPECPGLANPAWSNSQSGRTERWVEVRACYRFTSLLQLPIFSLGDVSVERTRSFVIPCYFKLGEGPCG